MASAIDKIDQNLIRADIGIARTESETLVPYLVESWGPFWLFVLAMGVPAAGLVWLVGGWWYNVRLRWCGAKDWDRREARLVYTFAGVVAAAPVVAYALAETVLFPNYRAAWTSEALWPLLILVFPFWSVVVSYKGVRARFAAHAARARVWFLVLPILVYALLFGAAGTLLNRSPSSDLDNLAALRLADPDSAVAGLEQYLKSRPSDDLAWTILGHTYQDLNEGSKAEGAYEKALAINSRRVEALTGMGVLRDNQGGHREALAYYHKALEIDPNYAQAHSSITVIALRQGNNAKALESAKKAFSLDSTDAVIAANLALSYHYNGMLEMRDRMTAVAKRLGYNIDALQEHYSGERTIRDRD